MMNIKSPAKDAVEVLRERILELETMESAGVALPDTRRRLLAVRGLLAKIDRKLPEHFGKTLH